MSCVFCAIAKSELPAEVIWRGEYALAFLDTRPLFPGHVLLVPNHHVVTLKDLPAKEAGPLLEAAQLLERAVEEGLDAEGTFIAINNIVSQSVPHLHVHIVPRRKRDGLKGFFWPRNPYAHDEEMREVADRIRKAIPA